MEKIIKTVLGSIALLLLLSSCVDYAYTGYYEYVNESGHDIAFERYYYGELQSSYNLPSGESMRESRVSKGDVPEPLFLGPIKIVFDNERVLEYSHNKEGVSNEIFFNRNYTEIPTKDEYSQFFRWTFTPEHYEMAVPIESENPQ